MDKKGKNKIPTVSSRPPQEQQNVSALHSTGPLAPKAPPARLRAREVPLRPAQGWNADSQTIVRNSQTQFAAASNGNLSQAQQYPDASSAGQSYQQDVWQDRRWGSNLSSIPMAGATQSILTQPEGAVPFSTQVAPKPPMPTQQPPMPAFMTVAGSQGPKAAQPPQQPQGPQGPPGQQGRQGPLAPEGPHCQGPQGPSSSSASESVPAKPSATSPSKSFDDEIIAAVKLKIRDRFETLLFVKCENKSDGLFQYAANLMNEALGDASAAVLEDGAAYPVLDRAMQTLGDSWWHHAQLGRVEQGKFMDMKAVGVGSNKKTQERAVKLALAIVASLHGAPVSDPTQGEFRNLQELARQAFIEPLDPSVCLSKPSPKKSQPTTDNCNNPSSGSRQATGADYVGHSAHASSGWVSNHPAETEELPPGPPPGPPPQRTPPLPQNPYVSRASAPPPPARTDTIATPQRTDPPPQNPLASRASAPPPPARIDMDEVPPPPPQPTGFLGAGYVSV